MKVHLPPRGAFAAADGSFIHTDDRVTCEMGGASVEVRHDGDRLVVVIKNGRDHRVEMEAEIDGVWHEVARCDAYVHYATVGRCDAYVHYATVGRITYRMAWVLRCGGYALIERTRTQAAPNCIACITGRRAW